MTIKKSKLTAIMFILAMTSAVCGYSQSDFMLISGKTMTADERQQEIFQEVKTCFETEDIRIVQTKKYEVALAWIDKEVEKERRYVINLPNKETGIYLAVSLPKIKHSKESSKERKKTIIKEQEQAELAFSKVQNCLARENILVIETKDAEMLQMWIKEDEEGRNVSTNFNEATGVYTAVSSPKTDGNGKVMFRKID